MEVSLSRQPIPLQTCLHPTAKAFGIASLCVGSTALVVGVMALGIFFAPVAAPVAGAAAIVAIAAAGAVVVYGSICIASFVFAKVFKKTLNREAVWHSTVDLRLNSLSTKFRSEDIRLEMRRLRNLKVILEKDPADRTYAERDWLNHEAVYLNELNPVSTDMEPSFRHTAAEYLIAWDGILSCDGAGFTPYYKRCLEDYQNLAPRYRPHCLPENDLYEIQNFDTLDRAYDFYIENVQPEDFD